MYGYVIADIRVSGSHWFRAHGMRHALSTASMSDLRTGYLKTIINFRYLMLFVLMRLSVTAATP